MTVEDISRMTGMDETAVATRLEALLGERSIHRVVMPRGVFYSEVSREYGARGLM